MTNSTEPTAATDGDPRPVLLEVRQLRDVVVAIGVAAFLSGDDGRRDGDAQDEDGGDEGDDEPGAAAGDGLAALTPSAAAHGGEEHAKREQGEDNDEPPAS
jgi:hypothetical protein